jgi:hypothetical protein
MLRNRTFEVFLTQELSFTQLLEKPGTWNSGDFKEMWPMADIIKLALPHVRTLHVHLSLRVFGARKLFSGLKSRNMTSSLVLESLKFLIASLTENTTLSHLCMFVENHHPYQTAEDTRKMTADFVATQLKYLQTRAPALRGAIMKDQINSRFWLSQQALDGHTFYCDGAVLYVGAWFPGYGNFPFDAVRSTALLPASWPWFRLGMSKWATTITQDGLRVNQGTSLVCCFDPASSQ